MINLDEHYGTAITPKEQGSHEHVKQRSWLLVDRAGALELIKFLSQALQGDYLCRLLIDDFNMLWLIAEDGTLRVALEEIVLSELQQMYYAPMPRAMLSKVKLGHPALVEGGKGRIGGELSLNPQDGTVHLTNKSGRFGFMRTPTELENAADLFRGLGIDVSPSYMVSKWS